jgi:hypothetical protein
MNDLPNLLPLLSSSYISGDEIGGKSPEWLGFGARLRRLLL